MSQIEQLYRSLTGCEAEKKELLPLSGSARKYFRVSGEGGTFIACAGTNQAENKAFLTIDRQFRRAGLHAPEVFAVSDDSMTYLRQQEKT